tara:strand:- start:116 stop:709 length:594 start_codon:yes stop_codon:yes gene_type:complete
MGARGPGAAAGTVGGSKGGMRVHMRVPAKVQRFFDGLGVVAEDALDEALTDVAHKIQTKAMENLAEGYKGPTGEDGGALDTGRLQNSIQMDDAYLEKRVGSNLNYAAHMEFGTGPAAGRKRYMPPTEEGAELESWSRRKGIDAGKVALLINRRGTFPRRYLGRAVFTEKTEVLHLFADYLEEQINTELDATVRIKRR